MPTTDFIHDEDVLAFVFDAAYTVDDRGQFTDFDGLTLRHVCLSGPRGDFEWQMPPDAFPAEWVRAWEEHVAKQYEDDIVPGCKTAIKAARIGGGN